MQKFRFVAIAIGCLLLVPAHAGIIYDESIDGDFSDTLPGTFAGALANGSNVVIGSSFLSKASPKNGSPTFLDRDHFSFSVSDTAELSFQYTVLQLTQSNSDLHVDFLLAGPNGTVPVNPTFFNYLSTGSVFNIPTITVGPGTYLMYAEAVTFGFAGTGVTNWDYEWDITATGLPSAVPGPAPWLLLAFGLVAVVATRKRSRVGLR